MDRASPTLINIVTRAKILDIGRAPQKLPLNVRE
jgi:hypothetical protein